MSQDAIHTGEVDLDEDLFDFAGTARASAAAEPEEDLEEIFASFRDGAPAEGLAAEESPAGESPSGESSEVLLAVPVAPVSAPAPAPPSAAAPVARRAPAPPAAKPRPEGTSRVASAPPGAAPVARALEPARELAPAPRQSRLSKGVVAIALSVTLLNSALALVALRGRAPGREEPVAASRAPGEHVAREHAAGDAFAAPPRQDSASLPDPEAVDPAHAHPALDDARAQISRGEYSAARQRTYGLLAIIDRLEEPRRSALEADCQFLIAQSLHLEALARMGATE
jgi:hypothetical protein